MRLKLIIVEPKYQINLGYIARVSKNFGISRLFIVSPRAKLKGNKAIMFSKHASDLLKNAKIYHNFDESIKDCDMVVGTTGVWRKAKATFNRIFLLDDAISRITKVSRRNAVVGLVIGRDDIGLTPEELEKCDMVAYIGTNEQYPVLNMSHALAIMLYVLTKSNFKGLNTELPHENPEKKEMKHLFYLFDRITEKNKGIRNKKAVKSIFRRLIYNSQPSKQELHALITALK
jgi:tRNA/rRNA methyltransferase